MCASRVDTITSTNNNKMSQQVSPGLPVRLRRSRDSGALLFMFAFLGFLFYIIWDGLYIKETDVNLIVHGHDSYGNICGRNNKPIRFSEKSGQNYTSKPFTKYTLINSQFERYTLDSGRLKNGELIYVREHEEDNEREYQALAVSATSGTSSLAGAGQAPRPLQISRFKQPQQQQQQQQQQTRTPSLASFGGADAGTREALTRERLAANTQTNRVKFNGSSSAARPRNSDGDNPTAVWAPPPLQMAHHRERRSTAPSNQQHQQQQQQQHFDSYDPVELARTNRSLLNALRTNMMYQYPPMHAYSSYSAAAAVGPARTTNRTNPSDVIISQQRQQQQQHLLQNGSLTALTNMRRAGTDSTNLHKSSSARDDDFDNLVSSRQAIHTPYAAAAGGGATLATTTGTRYANSLLETQPLVSSVNQPHASPSLQAATHSTPLPPISMFRVNNRPANDSDRYDHTFVTPISVMTVAGAGEDRRPTYHMGGGGGGGGPPHTTSNTGISQSEVANQLLYLTECVSSCPSDHVELIFYRCMPNNWRFSLFPNAINVTRTFIDDILTDMSHCYRELIYTFSLALVLSLGLLILLRFLASIIIWSCLVLLILIFLSMACYSWLTFYNHIMDLEQVMPHDSVYAEKIASSDKWLIGSIFLTFITFAAIGTLVFMRKRILLVTTLFRESGKAVADMPLLLLQPLFTFAALAAIMAAWVLGLICLQSMKMPVVDVHTGFVVFRAETLYKIMKWYHIFAFLWVSHFAIACQHYVIGASVSKWYFSPNRYELSSPIGTSISELILYYLGSVALGSFLVAIFKVVRVITRQIQFLIQRSCMSPPLNANQALGATQASPTTSTSSCGSLGYVWRLFIWFFDNIVMIINRDAYVEIAIHGHSFLGGARRAFTVLASNPLRLLAIKSVGNFLLVIAKICVVVGTVSMAHVLIEGKSQQLNYAWSPIVITAIYAYIVAHWFLSVYEMVIDALFICYCEDYEQKNAELNRQINGSNFRAQILSNGQLY